MANSSKYKHLWVIQSSKLMTAVTIFVTHLALAAPIGSANPEKLVPRTYSKVRCEVALTSFSRFISVRQRIMQTPLKDPALEKKFEKWITLINDHLQLKEPLKADFDEISRSVDNLSSESKLALIENIKSMYLEVTSEKYQAVKLKELKRTLDLILSRIERPDLMFKIDHGRISPWATFSKYFETTRRHTGQELDYSARDIWNLIHWVQQKLKSEGLRDPRVSGSEIVLYGSFVNGRAVLKSSDIDALANDSIATNFVSRLNDDRYFKSFSADHIAANSSVKFSERSAAQISPIIFVINQHTIAMKVFAPLSYSEIGALESVNKPEIFILN